MTVNPSCLVARDVIEGPARIRASKAAVRGGQIERKMVSFLMERKLAHLLKFRSKVKRPLLSGMRAILCHRPEGPPPITFFALSDWDPGPYQELCKLLTEQSLSGTLTDCATSLGRPIDTCH
jgi:hypothetical protein